VHKTSHIPSSLWCGLLLLLISLVLTLPPSANAQSTSGGFSFRGGPGLTGRTYLITEFGLATLTESRTGNFSVSHATWDVGFMHNLGTRTALGGTLFLSTDDHFGEAYFVGLKPRFRFWAWKQLHVDASVGLLLTAFGGGVLSFDFPALIGHAGIGYGDWVSFVLQYENVKLPVSNVYGPSEPQERNWYVGAVTGSYIGAIGGALALAAIIVVRNAGFD
jgi:hypothetical protein